MSPEIKCGAKTKKGPCGKSPMKGQVRCELHGGKNPQAITKAQERLAVDKAKGILARVLGDAVPRDDPVKVLEQTLGEAVALQEGLRDLVGNLSAIRYESDKGDEQIRGELQAYLSLLGRTESIAAKMLSLDLEARRLRIEEAQAVLLAGVVFGLLEDLKLQKDKRALGFARARLETIDGHAENRN